MSMTRLESYLVCLRDGHAVQTVLAAHGDMESTMLFKPVADWPSRLHLTTRRSPAAIETALAPYALQSLYLWVQRGNYATLQRLH